MGQRNKQRRIANLIRRFPKLISLPYRLFRFVQTKYTVGVVGVVFNEKGQVLLVEHVYHPKLPWGLPGGWVNHNEDPKIAVEREFTEELSLKVEVCQILSIEKTYHNHLDIAYLCHSSEAIGELSDELLDYQWFNLEQLPTIKSFHYQAIQESYRIFRDRKQIV